MIDNIEMALSKRSICKKCNEKIFRNEPRGVRIIGGFYCFKCSKKVINLQIKTSKRLQEKLKKIVKIKTKLMIINRLK